MKFFSRSFLLSAWLLLAVITVNAQQNGASDSSSSAPDSAVKYKLVSAGPEYKSSGWHQFLWGKNYRKEWTTPVSLPLFYLNEHKGGLLPDKLGGGHQTTSLHLVTKDDKNYALRSVDKQLGKVLPDMVKGTFIEDIANDEVSMSNPYGAAAVPLMAQSAGIYHIANPEFVYVPKQAALDTFNDVIADHVYLFEQRLKGDWHDADNLGNFKEFFDTDDVIKKMQDETENRADQKTWLKERLFDMLIGDWDRHHDQWGWGERKTDGRKIYVPVPQDRDQAFSKHSGVLLSLVMSAAGINYMQSFSGKIKNVNTFNFEERGLDRFFTNELNKEQWDSIAKDLQQSLTDSIIERAVQQLPAKIFAINGKKLISDLKSRRDHITEYADEYYSFLNKEVEVVGTKGTDYFTVDRINNDETSVKVYNIDKDAVKVDRPYYSRVFKTDETKEIRLFGLSGKDVYNTTGKVNNGIKIRIIGGDKKDTMLLHSLIGSNTKTIVYDDKTNYIKADGKVREKSSGDSIHKFDYMSYIYDKRGISPTFFYSDADRFYVGLGYKWEHHAWRKLPYVFKQTISANYSISQRAVSFAYLGIFPNTIGNWTLNVLAKYDAIQWTNFFGLGNETVLTTKNIDFNRARTKEMLTGLAFNKKLENNYFEIAGFYQRVKVVNDDGRYIALKVQPSDPAVFAQKNFAGAKIRYAFKKLNRPIAPTAGIDLSVEGSYTQNTHIRSQSFWKYGGQLQLYIPLFYKFSIATSAGAETVDGNPEFYQYPEIGGGQDLRGFKRQRFYGKTAFYNSNELRFISDVKNYVYSGKAGVLAFVDDGRVWMPGEKSNTLHVGYGGGIFLAPFNKISADITYGFSKEDHLLQFRFNLKL